jgi:hypothetical protein
VPMSASGIVAWELIDQIPNAYIATNWPIRYASISSDGRLIAVAGRRGLTHYSASSGRWKLFVDERQERDFIVRGGLLWFHHVLVAAVEVDRQYQVSHPYRGLRAEIRSGCTRETSTWRIRIFCIRRRFLRRYSSCRFWTTRCSSTPRTTRCTIFSSFLPRTQSRCTSAAASLSKESCRCLPACGHSRGSSQRLRNVSGPPSLLDPIL